MKKIIRISTVPASLKNFLLGQLKWLSEQYEVVAVSSPGEALDVVKQREGVRTVAVPMERHIAIGKDLVSLFRLIVLFAKERPDAIHSMTPKAGLLAMLAAWVTRVPVRMHTFTGLVFPTEKGLKQKLLIWMDRLTCWCATYINPEGQGVKKDLERYRITRKPLHVIGNGNVRGVDLAWYDRTPEVLRLAEPLKKKDVFTFCFVGRLVGDKGINELVRAFVKLNREFPKTRLLLVGPFENTTNSVDVGVKEMIKNKPTIVSVGKQLDVRPYLAASDAYVLPSYREGFPNGVLEAGAMGLPCIVTNISGCNEIILEGINGNIIPPQDEESLFLKMKIWVENTNQIKKMAENARRLVAERFDKKIVWNALLHEYQKLLNS